MVTNRYNHTLTPGVRGSQNLLDQLNREAIQFAGVEMYYIPRDTVSIDQLFNEDIQSRFDEAYPMEMYLESIEGFDGQELLEKFGVEVRDEVTLVVNKLRFIEVLHSTPHSTIERPREGDLIYIPFSKGIYEIMFVEHEQPFYQLGTVPNYKFRAELFEYSGEDFDTNIEGLDKQDDSQDNSLEYEGYVYKIILDSAGDFETQESITQSTSSHAVTGEIVRITDSGKTLWVSNVSNNKDDDSYGIFLASEQIVSSETGITRTVTSVVPSMDDYADNDYIESSADSIIDKSETNHFGYDF